MRKTTLILTLLLLSLMAEAQMVWFDGKNPVTYSVPKNVEPVVKIALDMWKSDMQQVTGMEPVASTKPKIKVLRRAKRQSRAVQGKGVADGFRIYIKGEQIIVEGNNGRLAAIVPMSIKLIGFVLPRSDLDAI